MEEFWKTISEEFSRYEVSDMGRVRVAKSGRFLKISKDPRTPSKNPYYQVHLLSAITGRYVQMRVHVLVARCFIPNPLNKPQVNHRFGIKSDNRASELEWMTASENIKHSFTLYPDKLKGERNNMAKLTDAAVEEIRTVCKVGSRVNRAAMATKYNVSEGAIRFAVTGHTWKHLASKATVTRLTGKNVHNCRFSQEEIEDMRAAYQKGKRGCNLSAVAKRFRCSTALVWQVACNGYRAGAPPPGPQPPPQ